MDHVRTERLIVRDWAVDDAPAALGIYGRGEVARWLGAPPMRPVTSLEAMREGVGRLIARNTERPGFRAVACGASRRRCAGRRDPAGAGTRRRWRGRGRLALQS